MERQNELSCCAGVEEADQDPEHALYAGQRQVGVSGVCAWVIVCCLSWNSFLAVEARDVLSVAMTPLASFWMVDCGQAEGEGQGRAGSERRARHSGALGTSQVGWSFPLHGVLTAVSE